jgi:antitoxin component YwqK of YwqJK toxin-antitoxin module
MTNRQNIKDLELIRLDGGGTPIYHFNNKPFTGIVFDIEEDGTLSWEEEYIDGFQEGWTRTYHPNGKPEEECKMHNNVIVDGTYKKWDANGNIIYSD